MSLEEIFKQLITGNWVTLATWTTDYTILRNVEIFKKKKFPKKKFFWKKIPNLQEYFIFQNELIFW
jgi:uncharacterized pyridoxamine 5'-phosphate oxidase family protein